LPKHRASRNASTGADKSNKQRKVPVAWLCLFVCLMVFNATFNNISVISWRSVLFVEETGGPRENHWHVAGHIMLYTSPWSRFELTTSVVIATDCIGSCKSNYHTITATTAPNVLWYVYELCFIHLINKIVLLNEIMII
jgi:hypothetical protein